MKTKSAFVNNGFEELNITQIYEMSGLTPDNIIVSHNSKPYVPRKMYNYFIPQINHYSRAKDSLLACLVVESNSKKYFYSPSMTLFATMERKNEDEIRGIMGQQDNPDSAEQDKINKTIDYIKAGKSLDELRETAGEKRGIIGKYSHIEKKRLENILESRALEDVFFNGHAYSAKSKSKKTDEFYSISQKQWITFQNGMISVPDSLQASCTCGFSQASFLKYEFERIASQCSHIELLRQTVSNPLLGKRVRLKNKYGNTPIACIKNLFSPFSPLDYPENESKSLRSIIRNGLYNFIVSQSFIEENFNDSKGYHKNNGFTWFRCELDAYLLSFKETYNRELYNLWMNNIDENESIAYTCNFFGDTKATGKLIPANAVHELNEDTNVLDHFVNGTWMNVKHLGIDSKKGIEGILQDCQFTHDKNNNYSHEITDYSAPKNLEIRHVIEEMTPVIDFDTPFKVGVLNNRVKIYIRPYQMRDSKN